MRQHLGEGNYHNIIGIGDWGSMMRMKMAMLWQNILAAHISNNE